jgi:hypothetical protein
MNSSVAKGVRLPHGRGQGSSEPLKDVEYEMRLHRMLMIPNDRLPYLKLWLDQIARSILSLVRVTVFH